jgi:putative glycosyltransferase (TIGR04348 family)
VARILIVTPAPPRSLAGNRITATRWARQLRSLGHTVQVAEAFTAQRADLLIALHARRSARSVAAFSANHPDLPVVVALTGTDLYGDIRHNNAAQRSLEIAAHLVLLQPDGLGFLPERHHQKARVIRQSARPPSRALRPLKSAFEICVCGHLRPVKDPFRAALAARDLPDESRIRITHLGAALTPAMEQRAISEMQRNPRYEWRGEVPQWRARQLIARSRLLVVTSKLEGGANVISEALVANVPVISSRISGSVGLLGNNYRGYFDVGSTRQLRSLLLRCERDSEFYDILRHQCRAKTSALVPEAERAAWQSLLAELGL